MIYSQASKFTLDNNLSWGDIVQKYPENCTISEIQFSNPEIFIDKLPRPGFQKYRFKDKSSISIDVNGKFLGISGAYTSKKIKSEDDFIEAQEENEKYDLIYHNQI